MSGFEIKGIDDIIGKLQDLRENPQQLLQGIELTIPKEINCEWCHEQQMIDIPVNITNVSGSKCLGPGGSKSVQCSHCGRTFDVTWDKVEIDVEIKE